MAGKSDVVCSARVAISSRERPRTRTPSPSRNERAISIKLNSRASAGGLADRVAMRIEAVQQRRLHRAAPDVPLVEATGADVRPGLDRPVALGGPVNQRAAGRIQSYAVAHQSIAHGLVEPELARRVVDAGDAGSFLGDHPPSDVFSGLGIGAAILMLRMMAPHQGGAVVAGRCKLLGRRGLGDRRRLGAPPGHGVLVGLAGGGAVRGDLGAGRRHRLIHVCALRLLGVLRPGDAGSPLRAHETAGRETLALAKAGGAIGADRHRRQLHRLPVDRPPDRHLAVLLAHLVGADGVADRDVADDAGTDVLPQRLDVVAGAEADGGATLVGTLAAGAPGQDRRLRQGRQAREGLRRRGRMLRRGSPGRVDRRGREGDELVPTSDPQRPRRFSSGAVFV